MSATLTVAPTQWANLRDIHDVRPLNDDDFDCLTAVRDVLKQYGMQERFGVALLHKHFDMSPDEILLEETDVINRVLRIQPIPATTAGPNIQTIWMLLDGGPAAMMGCRQYCGKDVQGNHNSFHRAT